MAPISFRARDGRRMFAFHPATDPLDVLVELAWAWPSGQSVCGSGCPTPEGGYCMDCHLVAYGAREAARDRMV